MSISVFSKHLFEYKAAIETARLRKTVPADYSQGVRFIIEWCKNDARLKDDPRVLLGEEDFTDEIAFEASYKTCTSWDVRRVCKWINENIVLKIGEDTYPTRWVKIRIATDMINKLVYSGKIPKHVGIYYHDSFVNNVLGLAQDYDTEGLPF